MFLLDQDIEFLSEQLSQDLLSPEDLINEAYKRIEKYDDKINSFITLVDKDVAISFIKNYTNKFKGNKSPLFGIPFVMKDAYITQGIRTTAASKILSDYIPQYSATVYKRLTEQGAVLIGKMNMDAWGHGASNENSDFGPVKNPWDQSRISGGSGGGPAAALAARLATFGIGEDTGGSIRNPAAWCGISALKVTYGRVSRYGAISYASSLDTVGPTARSARDLAYVLEAIAGLDSFDATSSPHNVPKYSQLIDKSLKGKKIAFPTEFYSDALDPEIKRAIITAKGVFTSLGVQFDEINIPMLEYGVPVYYILAPSETSSNLAKYDGIRYGNGRDLFTRENERRIMTGTFALSTSFYDAYYKKAQKVRTLFIEKYNEVLSKYDAILAPVTPTLPPKIGELLNDPVRNMMADIYTVTANITGLPSLSLPCGFSSNKLPIGMQLMGKMFSEDLLLNMGNIYQENTNWHKVLPSSLKD